MVACRICVSRNAISRVNPLGRCIQFCLDCSFVSDWDQREEGREGGREGGKEEGRGRGREGRREAQISFDFSFRLRDVRGRKVDRYLQSRMRRHFPEDSFLRYDCVARKLKKQPFIIQCRPSPSSRLSSLVPVYATAFRSRLSLEVHSEKGEHVC